MELTHSMICRQIEYLIYSNFPSKCEQIFTILSRHAINYNNYKLNYNINPLQTRERFGIFIRDKRVYITSHVTSRRFAFCQNTNKHHWSHYILLSRFLELQFSQCVTESTLFDII